MSLNKTRPKSPNAIYFLIIITMLIWLIPDIAFSENKRDTFFGEDKIKHFIISAAMTASTGFVAHNHFQARRDDAILIGFSVSFGLGGLKEIVDKSIPGETSSWKDLVVDFIGCAAGAAILAGVTK